LRVGVLGDTHGKIKKAKKAVEQMGDIKLLIHTGDYYEDALILSKVSGIKVKAVTGNCDSYAPGPVEELLKIGDFRLYLTHGHLFGVKSSLARLYQRAEELGAHIVIYGHTHMPYQEKRNGILFLNPGSITWPRLPGQHSFAVLEFHKSGSSYTVETCEL
jgi:putative phosphoesterase